MSDVDATGSPSQPTDSVADEASSEQLQAELALLREQNKSLRESYVQAKRTQYRRTAKGLAIVGGVAAIGGLILPGAREVLFVLSAIGLFGAVLTNYLTPERFLAAEVATAMLDTLIADRDAIVDELGLSTTQIYVPTGERNTQVRLFVPQTESYELPPDDDLTSLHVISESEQARGVAFRPTGSALYTSFEQTVSGSVSDDPRTLGLQLTDALAEQFDLIGGAQVDVDSKGNVAVVGVSDSAYGAVDRIDHPVSSLIAVGLARQLGTPVTVETTAADNDRIAYRITCQWSATHR